MKKETGKFLLGVLAVIIVGALSFCLLCLIGSSGAGAATIPKPVMVGRLWLMKRNDYLLEKQYVPALKANWIGCGITTDPADVAKIMHCAKGDDRIYTDYWTLKDAILNGTQRPGTTVILDQEFWSVTPWTESHHPLRFLKWAAQLCAAHGITIIETPVGQSINVKDAQFPQQKLEVEAARYAPIVELQDQYLMNDPALYIKTVIAAVKAMRAANPSVVILAGLMGTNGPDPSTAADMYADYEGTLAYTQGDWLNVDTWFTGNGCAPQGCPLIVKAFLAKVGVG